MIKFIIKISLALIFFSLGATISAKNKMVTYPGIYSGVPQSSIYKVSIKQGTKNITPVVFMNSCNIYDEMVPGTQAKDKTPLTEYQGRTISYTHISFSGAMEVEITLTNLEKVPMSDVRILPARFGIKATKTAENKFKFIIDKPGQYSVEVGENGYKNGLLFFADPLETDVPKIDASWMVLKAANRESINNRNTTTALYFKAGVHNIGVYKVPANIKKIYIEGGAWVYGSFIMMGDSTSGVKIYGRGVLSGAKLNLRESHQIEAANGSNNITVSGITISDYSYFAVRLLGKNNLVEWTKIVGGWIWNCDGIAAWEGSTIRHCFIWANDDNIKIYQDNITVKDVVCWQLSNGAIFQLNWGNMRASNCRIKNVDIVRAEWHDDRANNGVISCRTSGGAQSDFIFENVSVDNPVAFILRLSPQGEKPNPIDNFVFKNWNVKMDKSKNKKNYLEGSNPASNISGLVFENFKLNGKILNKQNFLSYGRFSIKNCDFPVFKNSQEETSK